LSPAHNYTNNIRAVHWVDHQRSVEGADNPTRPCTFIPKTGTCPLGMTCNVQVCYLEQFLESTD